MFEKHTLFESGKDAYHTYRIPSLLIAGNGDVLAFCEGRLLSRRDDGQIDLLMKRSSDGGKTWSIQEIVVSEPEMTCGNPCPVLDKITGNIVMLFCKNNGNGGEGQIIKGLAKRTVWVTSSSDNGKTWTTPKEITSQVKKTSWTWYATGPGHGIQLKTGRLIAPCDHRTALEPELKLEFYSSHIIYSDDHGSTWQIGAILSLPGNESCAIELDDGSVYLNCRKGCLKKNRSYGISKDNGFSFIEEGWHKDLKEFGCEGSLLKISEPGNSSSRILFSRPSNTKNRSRLTIYSSFDQCRTWTKMKLINKGLSAYSDMAQLNDGTILCIYENGEEVYSEKLTIARFTAKWLIGRTMA